MRDQLDSADGAAPMALDAPPPLVRPIAAPSFASAAAEVTAAVPTTTTRARQRLDPPKLQNFEDILKLRDQYVGPTDESNWVMPGWLLVGAYPASVNDEENYSLLSSILVQGVSMFVCLQKEYQTEGVTEEMWRHGLALRPYFDSALEVTKLLRADENLAKQNVRITPELKFVHFPIEDCSVGDDDAVLELAEQLVEHLLHGETLYVHCWGGHGRTGTLICIMLHMMYEMEAIDAMRRCQFVHDLRRVPIQVGSPQTQAQRNQVCRVIRKLKARKLASKKEDGVRTAAVTTAAAEPVAVAPTAMSVTNGAEDARQQQQRTSDAKLPVVKRSYVAQGQSGDADLSQAAASAPAIKFSQPVPPWRPHGIVPPEPQSAPAGRRKISVPSPRVASTKVARKVSVPSPRNGSAPTRPAAPATQTSAATASARHT